MPFTSGTYSLPTGNPVVTGTTISSTTTNTTNSDIATALSSCILKDGTQTVTANIPMASHKFTGLSAPTTAGDSLAYGSPINTTAITGLTTALTVAQGGTGLTTLTAGYIPYGNGTSALSSSANLFFNGTTLNIAGSGGIVYANTFSQYTGATLTLEAGGGSGAVLFNTAGANERMRIDSSGNVGIGTSSPGYLLNVSKNGNGGDSAQLVRFTDTNTSNSLGPLHLTIGTTNHFALNPGPVLCGTNGIALGVGDGSDLAGQRRLTINSSGIVTMSAYGAGAATFSAAGVISSVSDETWKIKDGVPVDADSMLKNLEPGYWYYNDEKAPIFGTDRQLGFYAQNVNAAIGPEAAPAPEEGKPWGYYDRSVLAVTVMSLQKALTTIEALTARLTALEAK